MTIQLPKDTDILSWDPEDMDTYWRQCRSYDSRPHDTRSIMGNSLNQADSQNAFRLMLKRIEARLKSSKF